MFAETYRGDRPEPFNSCILQAWSIGMFIYAIREMMLGMKVNMIKNKIQFEPRIPESLRETSTNIDFEYDICTKQGNKSTFKIMVDPNREKISIKIKNNDDSGINTEPEIFSNTYSINVL
jgi:hypothetical protein